MIYKPIKLKNGSYYLCRAKPELATEQDLTTEEKVIIELSEMIEKIQGDLFVENVNTEF